MGRKSLEFRLCILTAGLLFALLLAVAHSQLIGQKNALVEKDINDYESLSKALAEEYGALAGGFDTEKCHGLAMRLLKADPNVSYVVISDSKKRMLFAETRQASPAQFGRYVGKPRNAAMRALVRMGLRGGGGSRDTAIPVVMGTGEVGTVNIGFRTQAQDTVADEMQARLMATFAVAFLLGVIGAVLLARSIVDPMRSLIKAFQAVSAGNLDVKVPVTTDDEIGELAQTFNRMVTALKDSHGHLVEKANTDSLTGLYNHRCFQERLSTAMVQAAKVEQPLSIIMLDIDHFKTMNDNYGHPFGDEVLRGLATTLSSCCRRSDILARYGGEEFAVVLPNTELDAAVQVAERLRRSIEEHRFDTDQHSKVPVTVSLGVAQYPVHSNEREGLIMAADLAMYQSKSLGRNRVTVFSSDFRTDDASDPYKLYLMLHASDMGTIEAMAAAVDAKVNRYQGFSRDVMQHCLDVAHEIGMSDSEMEDLKISGLLHDIGQLAIPEIILSKPGTLTEEERQIMRNHPALGAAIVQESTQLKSMLPGILHHHECWDGSGYPSGLKGGEIPVIARIIAVIDAYHAMTTNRPYAEAKSLDEAAIELRRCAGTQFDPQIVDAFIRTLEKSGGMPTKELKEVA